MLMLAMLLTISVLALVLVSPTPAGLSLPSPLPDVMRFWSTSRALYPECRASMTRVDVTSFSLKKRFTRSLRMLSALSLARHDRSWVESEVQNSLKDSGHSLSLASFSLRSSMNRRQIPSTLVRYTRTSSRRYCVSRHLNGRFCFSLITWTWALITNVSDTVKPSRTFDSSMNFFHPQSCSFLQNRWRVSEYLDFLGSLFTTAMVNCAKWDQPGSSLS
mmetsp:Transcript_8792/g.22636  ORF Transcript_8792/g.22636 Transcript_8792/m.22636 type:complete len:218 (-) Transcript_8792:923-1576(-)